MVSKQSSLSFFKTKNLLSLKFQWVYLWSPEETVWGGGGDVFGLWDGNPVKLDCYEHYITTAVINSFE